MKIVVSKENLKVILTKFAGQLNDKIKGLDINNMDLSKADLIVTDGTGSKLLSNDGQMKEVDIEGMKESLSSIEDIRKVIKISQNEDGSYTFTTDEIEIAESILETVKTDGKGDKFLNDKGEYVAVEAYYDITDSQINDMINSLKE